MACIYTPMILHIQIVPELLALTLTRYPMLNRLQIAVLNLHQDHLRSFLRDINRFNLTPHPIHPHSHEQQVLSNAHCLALDPVPILVTMI